MVYQIGPKEWIPPHPSSSRTQVENSFPYKQGTIQVHSHAIWIDERPRHLAGNDVHNLQR